MKITHGKYAIEFTKEEADEALEMVAKIANISNYEIEVDSNPEPVIDIINRMGQEIQGFQDFLDLEVFDRDDRDAAAAVAASVPSSVADRNRMAVVPSDLKQFQGETWLWMVANDNVRGVTSHALARHAGISTSAAGQRMQILVRSGHARRLERGRYRANR